MYTRMRWYAHHICACSNKPQAHVQIRKSVCMQTLHSCWCRQPVIINKCKCTTVTHWSHAWLRINHMLDYALITCLITSGLGKNSWRGGSKRRIVTGNLHADVCRCACVLINEYVYTTRVYYVCICITRIYYIYSCIVQAVTHDDRQTVETDRKSQNSACELFMRYMSGLCQLKQAVCASCISAFGCSHTKGHNCLTVTIMLTDSVTRNGHSHTKRSQSHERHSHTKGYGIWYTHPSMAVKIPSKSRVWKGSSPASALCMLFIFLFSYALKWQVCDCMCMHTYLRVWYI
jgi:hypothetical protein